MTSRTISEDLLQQAIVELEKCGYKNPLIADLKDALNSDPLGKRDYRRCEDCNIFGCPIFIRDPKIGGCKYSDVMDQIKDGMNKNRKGKDFEQVCKELGI